MIQVLLLVLLAIYGWRIYLDETTDAHPGRLYYLSTLALWLAVVWLQAGKKAKGSGLK
jgi:hypothetical protein